MNGKAGIILDNDRLLVSGEIDFGTAVSLWDNSLPLLERCKTLLFDFSKVTVTKSAGLALLLEWIKYAERERKQIHFQDLPAQLMLIAKVAGINGFLSSHSVAS